MQASTQATARERSHPGHGGVVAAIAAFPARETCDVPMDQRGLARAT